MAEIGRRKYALADFTVELRGRGWYFGRQYDAASKYRGPYNSIASVTLMIARQLRREVERRDKATIGRNVTEPQDDTAAPF
jgi:ribosome-associated translation inhibitor RaiA